MRILNIALIFCLLISSSCHRSQASTPEVNVAQVKELTMDPSDGVWEKIPLHTSKLILQDLVDPRLMEPSTQEVQVRAMTNGSEIALRLEWTDGSKNDLPGPKHFIDGCAVQFPAQNASAVPAPQMGEAGKSVEISFWRADWQAIVEGRADSINSIYPNATVDHYPSDAKPLEKDPDAQASSASRYAPARALGNNRSGPRDQPVEDLIAEGPSTLSPAPKPISRGKGVKTATGWAVVMVRPLPAGFSSGSPSQAAFAVWEGSHNETGARKMRTGWIQMIMK